MKRRHRHLTDVHIPLAVIFRYGRDTLEGFNDDARRDDDTHIVVEQDVLLGVLDSAGRTTGLAYRVERLRHVGQLVCAPDLPFSAFEDCLARSEPFYDRGVGAPEMFTSRVWYDEGVVGELTG